MRVLSKQRNSKMCIICGLDNPLGVRAPFYNMEDGSVMSVFRFREEHQSYPGRVHGGMITAMLDEMGLRALWTGDVKDYAYGVTLSLETKYRKPVPYGETLIGRGAVLKESGNFLTADCRITDRFGSVLANGLIKYVKLSVEKIAEDVSAHEELCYADEDGVREIICGENPAVL